MRKNTQSPGFFLLFLFLVTPFLFSAQELELRINTGGSEQNYEGETFAADSYFDTGLTLDRPQTGLPEPFQTFRFSRSQQMNYDIPVPDGEYMVKLYFAELWFGATGGGSGGVGSRVFDVTMEGVLAEDNLDIFAEVGPDAMLVKSHTVTVTGGILNVHFDSRDEVGGERHPVINAIEIIGNSASEPMIVVEDINDQTNEIGQLVNLSINANEGGSSEGLVYSISGQPSGVTINATTGEFSGTIDPSGVTGGTNGDGVHDVTVVVSKTGVQSVSIAFQWYVIDSSLCDFNAVADANIERFEAISQKIGDKIYVLGGFTFQVAVVPETEIYDASTDTWSIGASMPIPVTHTAAVAAGNDIWIIGGFAGDNPGVATDAVQVYHTISDSWSVGPMLPKEIGSGAGARVGNKIHFFGGLLADRQTDVEDHWVLDLENVNAGWVAAAPMPNPRNHHSGIAVNDIIYAIGGQTGHDIEKEDTQLVHAYDTTTDTWTRLADLTRPRSHFKAATTVHNGKIIIVGGIDNGPIVSDITEYDPQTNAWKELCKLPGEGLEEAAAQAIGDRLYIAGGRPVKDANVMLKETKWLQLEPNISQLPLVNAGDDTTITIPNNSVTLNGFGTDPDGGEVIFRWSQVNGPNQASLSSLYREDITVSNLIEGVYTFSLTVIDDENNSVVDTVQVTVNEEAIVPDFALRINAGGTATNYQGENFIGDQYANTGNTLDRPQTGLPEPFQTFRFSRSQQMSYEIPVPDGEYTVNLYFAELWFGATGGGSGGVGNRVFDVTIEGILTEDNLDIVAEVGADAMLVKSHTVTVTGGILNIDFDSRDVVGGERHPVINAIEILGQTAEPEERPFITTWKTDNLGSSNDNQITIPTFSGETYNYTVNWGDSTSNSGVTGDITHTYATPGSYQVSISGDFPRIYFQSGGDNEKLISVDQWGDIDWESAEGAFYGCKKMNVLASDTPDLLNVNSAAGMFAHCNSLVGNDSFENWETKTLVDISSMFSEAESFNQDISDWDVSSVLDMRSMFFGTLSFNQDISNWNTSKVNYMSNMFAVAISFNQDLSNWDTSAVIAMSDMFSNASAFNQDISSWDTSSVETMSGMFQLATSFDQDLGNWNMGNVSDLNVMFDQVRLSKENYDAILQGWSNQQLQNGVIFDGGNSEYCQGEEARQKLIDDFSWVITDGGKTDDCEEPESAVVSYLTIVGGSQFTEEIIMTDGLRIINDEISYFPTLVITAVVNSQTVKVNFKITDIESGNMYEKNDYEAPFDSNDVLYEFFGTAITGKYLLEVTPFDEFDNAGEIYRINYEMYNSCIESIDQIIIETIDATCDTNSDGIALIDEDSVFMVPDGFVYDSSISKYKRENLAPGDYTVYIDRFPLCAKTLEYSIGSTNECTNSDDIWLEAECAIVGANWSSTNDASASNGAFVLPPAGFKASASNDPANIVKFEFDATSDVYKIYVRTKTPTTTDDSFYVRVNGGAWRRWNNIPQVNNFQWNQIHDRELVNVPLTFVLQEGGNTLEFANREDGAGLDKIFITKSDTVPSDFGQSGTNCSSNLSARSFVANPSRLFPNPVVNTTTLSFEQPVNLTKINVYDITGRLVHSYKGMEGQDQGTYILSVNALPAGTYFLKSQDAQGQQYQKQMVIKK